MVLTSLPLRRRGDRPQRFRRGVFLLPSLFTVGNLFCGYACVVHAARGDYERAAVFVGVAMILDTLDGFIARLTNSSTAFGVQLDSLADIVSFGLAPAILAFTWGLVPLGRIGWAAGFLYGLVEGYDLERCGEIASACGYEVCRVVGASVPPDGWDRVRKLLAKRSN